MASEDVLNDDVALLEDDVPIQAEVEGLVSNHGDRAHGGHHSC